MNGSATFTNRFPTYPLPGGGRCSVPVEWPQSVWFQGSCYDRAGEGARSDGEPAAVYAGYGQWSGLVWFCGGDLYSFDGRRLGPPSSVE